MKIRNAKGFTLIEVLVAMMILFLLATPITKVFHQEAVNTKARGKSTQALYLAQQIMEEIISGNEWYSGEGECPHLPGFSYRLSYTPRDGMVLVTVRVFHESWDRNREISLSTLLPPGN